MTRGALPAALLVAVAAFALYRATLLPGVDFGDTGSFQTMVGSPLITPRDGYPLYFAIGTAILGLTGGDPAHALNLASAIEAAVAAGLIVLVAVELSGSIAAAVGVALLFATSYTFWSQAIIAEVYALHIAFVALTLLLLLRWANVPSGGRLFAFFAVYAVGFGNHLSMILLLPGYAIFLLLAAPRGWRSMVAPSVIVMAAACAAVGALQYLWNLRTLWLLPDPPHNVVDALQRFWFDVTKSDWRDTMVMNVPQSRLGDHLAMYWFDLRQQFGVAGPLLAAAGLLQLALTNARRAILLLTLFAANALFAYSYNVGDAHVFYLPSHLLLALMAAPAVTLAGRFAGRAGLSLDLLPRVASVLRGGELERHGTAIAGALLALYAATRGYHDFPALDRSRDTRPSAVVEAITAGLDDRRDVLIADLNWQVGNGLSYFVKVKRPEIVYTRLADVLLYAPALVADNRAIGRSVALTERARATVQAAYGPLLPIARDARVPVQGFAEVIRTVPVGSRYVLCVLEASGDSGLETDELTRAIATLTAGQSATLPAGAYAVVAGSAGGAPDLIAARDRPFRREIVLRGVPVEIRMDSWLVSDTIRRMGFGHVVAARQHTLIVERGVSFVAFDDHGTAIRTAYASNIYAPQARYLIDSAR
jgi:transmembrane protein TMEM260 (protein O-mannosyltransferase)